MLSINEFTAGSLSDAQPLALMLPCTKYGEPFLIGKVDQKRCAVFLGESHRFEHFVYDEADNWSGLIIKGVRIEVDEGTIFHPDYDNSTLGSIVRRGNQLCICVRGFGNAHPISLIEDLDPLPDQHKVGFLRWQIVIGQASEKRVLARVDLREEVSVIFSK